MEPSRPESRRETGILFYTCGAHAFTHVYMVTFTAILAPMCKGFGMSSEELTACASVSVLFFGLGALPAGWLGDHWGEKRLLVVFFFLTALGGTIVGLSRTSFELTCGMGCMGLGASIFHPVGNAMIARGIAQPGRAMGTNGLWGSVGEAVGPLLAVQVTVLLSWRWAYLVLTVPMLLLGVSLACSGLRIPARPPPVNKPRGKVKLPVLLLLLFTAMMFGGVMFWLVKTMLPTHLGLRTGEEGVSLLHAGYLTSLVYAIGGVGQYITGRLVHRGRGLGIYALIFLLGIPSLLAVGRLQGVALVGMSGAMSMLLFSPQPVENVLLARLSPERWKGLVFGLKFVLTFGIGGIGTYLSGVVESERGTGAVFTVAAGVATLAFLVALGAWLFSRRSSSGSP